MLRLLNHTSYQCINVMTSYSSLPSRNSSPLILSIGYFISAISIHQLFLLTSSTNRRNYSKSYKVTCSVDTIKTK